MGESKGSESSVPSKEGRDRKLHKGPGELTHPRARGWREFSD